MSEFDEVSTNYEDILSIGLSLSGENSDYFAHKRVEHTAKLQAGINAKSETIMDYGLKPLTPKNSSPSMSQKNLWTFLKRAIKTNN
jgi:hypothetical protein